VTEADVDVFDADGVVVAAEATKTTIMMIISMIRGRKRPLTSRV